MHGRDAEFSMGPVGGRFTNPEEQTFGEMLQRLRDVRAVVRDGLEKHRAEMKEDYDRAVAKFFKDRKFARDQLVWITAPPHYKHRPGNVPGLPRRFLGPYRIDFVCGEIMWVRPINAPNADLIQVHTDQAKACLFDDKFDDKLPPHPTPFSNDSSGGASSRAGRHAN